VRVFLTGVSCVGKTTVGMKLATLRIRFNQDKPRESCTYFGQEFYEMAQQKGDLTDEEYLRVPLPFSHRWQFPPPTGCAVGPLF
jgi:hypothetical protein